MAMNNIPVADQDFFPFHSDQPVKVKYWVGIHWIAVEIEYVVNTITSVLVYECNLSKLFWYMKQKKTIADRDRAR